MTELISRGEVLATLAVLRDRQQSPVRRDVMVMVMDEVGHIPTVFAIEEPPLATLSARIRVKLEWLHAHPGEWMRWSRKMHPVTASAVRSDEYQRAHRKVDGTWGLYVRYIGGPDGVEQRADAASASRLSGAQRDEPRRGGERAGERADDA